MFVPEKLYNCIFGLTRNKKGGRYKNKAGNLLLQISRLCELSYEDSNLDRQNQKLQCYHYTIRQSSQPRLIVPIAVQS